MAYQTIMKSVGLIKDSIFISPHWDIEFHVHIDASNMVIGVMLMNKPHYKATNRLFMHHDCSTMMNEII
jgi:hypothetical protein